MGLGWPRVVTETSWCPEYEYVQEQVLGKQKTQRILGREDPRLKSHKGTCGGSHDRRK